MIIIQLADLPSYRQNVVLDGRVFNVSIAWNDRQKSWTMSLADSDEDPIISGVAIVKNYPLLAQYADVRLPAGDFVAIDESGSLENIGRDDLTPAGSVRLIYATADELAAL